MACTPTSKHGITKNKFPDFDEYSRMLMWYKFQCIPESSTQHISLANSAVHQRRILKKPALSRQPIKASPTCFLLICQGKFTVKDSLHWYPHYFWLDRIYRVPFNYELQPDYLRNSWLYGGRHWTCKWDNWYDLKTYSLLAHDTTNEEVKKIEEKRRNHNKIRWHPCPVCKIDTVRIFVMAKCTRLLKLILLPWVLLDATCGPSRSNITPNCFCSSGQIFKLAAAEN